MCNYSYIHVHIIVSGSYTHTTYTLTHCFIPDPLRTSTNVQTVFSVIMADCYEHYRVVSKGCVTIMRVDMGT